ncbi:MAG TPA: ABC transporter ATP-binding protein [bacterium]|nr:ABC transporter ATP-binding protein [bacterium]HPN43680.1 ABC transporter ATP-binding protein [bacterium]
MQISINNLTQVYRGGHKALNDINLEISSGMFGLLGPNGAGKTTLMRILVTLLKPTGGIVKFNDYDLLNDRKKIRSMLGYLPQDFQVISRLKTWEFLDYVAGLAGLKNKTERSSAVDEMLERVGLFNVRERKATKLSGGMKRRLGIAQALIGHPQVVIVDEPTTGLDPEERIRFRNLLAELSHKDIIIILSTHIVGDISSTCTNMALLNKGQLVFNDAPEKLVEKCRGHVWLINALDSEMEAIKEKYPVISTIPVDSGWEVQVVADDMTGFQGKQIDPNLEHAYVYHMEYGLNNAQ